jgi:hypothetical protein
VGHRDGLIGNWSERVREGELLHSCFGGRSLRRFRGLSYRATTKGCGSTCARKECLTPLRLEEGLIPNQADLPRRLSCVHRGRVTANGECMDRKACGGEENSEDASCFAYQRASFGLDGLHWLSSMGHRPLVDRKRTRQSVGVLQNV